MSALSERSGRGGGVLAAALARAHAFLLEPPTDRPAAPAFQPGRPPVVVVRGLARGCGASAVARALTAVLARDDPAGAAVLVGGPSGFGPRLASPPALRLARMLAASGCDAVRASGRVCLVADLHPGAAESLAHACPLVIDVGHASPPAEGLGHADVAVLVASPVVEPALVAAVEASLTAAGHRVEVVANRVDPADAGRERREDPAARRALRFAGAPLAIAESRLAAQLALACREPRGPFAVPIAELAERCRSAAPG